MSVFRILNPGPSLATYSPAGFGGVTIAVNRAAVAFHSDAWAACDYPMIRDYQHRVLGAPMLLTKRQTWADIGPRCRLALAAIVEDLPMDGAPPWQLKTMTCAMAFAVANGATRIELYGCDWSGTADYDGAEAGEDRTDARWAKERADVAALTEWLAGRGVEVVRN
jgi:hypothetical protein